MLLCGRSITEFDKLRLVAGINDGTVSDDAPEFQELLATFYAEAGYVRPPGRLEYVPDDPDLLSGFGWSLYVTGDTEGALENLEAALALAPENPQALYYKARILVETGQNDQALPLLEILAAFESVYSDWANVQLRSLKTGQ